MLVKQNKTFKRHIPNGLTSLNLLSGSIAILFALEGNYTVTFWLVMIAAIFDFLDGFAARLLKVISPFGKVMDSLADMVSFGVVPAMVMFVMIKNSLACTATLCGNNLLLLLPYAAFLIAVCSGLRLAKFHVDERQTDAFIGLPTPANAILITSLAMASHGLPEVVIEKLSCPYTLVGITVLLSFLLVAEIPMFSLKFHPTTKQLLFAAICNRKGFLEMPYRLRNNLLRYIFIFMSLILIILWQIRAIPVIVIMYILISVFFYKKN